jgi:adenine-specific DNA methylase
MIPRECKRLAEVDFPIAVVSKHALREKNIRHGHPSTLHLWWARRPLASCRAMLLALLLPDPCDERCPDDFIAKARQVLEPIPGKVGESKDDLRAALLRFIGDFADWNYAASPTFLEAGRALVRAAYLEETPLVVDPFAGGGSIPLEALRLGCDALASDLNPVACLIMKALLEDIPRYGTGLSDELRRVGQIIKSRAEAAIFRFYPPDPDGATPIAYLWARTVRCEAPNCGAEIPLMRSFWLCRKSDRRRALRSRVIRNVGALPQVTFDIFKPTVDTEVPRGTVTRAKATCVCCGTTLPADRVRAQLAAQHGVADAIFDEARQRIGGARMLAVVTLRKDVRGREYRLPMARDYAAVYEASSELKRIAATGDNPPLSTIPHEPTPKGGGSGAGRAFSVHSYGMREWKNLFTARQTAALLSFVLEITTTMDAGVHKALGLLLSRVVDRNCALCTWRSQADQEKVEHVFARQALPPVWDFAEAVVTTRATGSWLDGLDVLANAIDATSAYLHKSGQVSVSDAVANPLPSDSVDLWFTDPPYYDAVPYADLSDFFFAWLKRALPGHPLLRDPFDAGNALTPKAEEIVQDETNMVGNRPKDRVFFEEAMARAFAEGRRVIHDDGMGSVVFAHKTTEGWEALLSGLSKGGWVVTASWPIATEAATRLRARDSAALATSVHLVCRPRTEDKTGDWADVLRELPERVGEWMARLDREGVRGADLVFACIGPALEIFSRYLRVETAEGREVRLAEYLEKVWEVVGREALHQVLGTAEAQASNGGAGALEEDARLTALFLWTIRSTAGDGEAASVTEEDEVEADDAEQENGGRRKAPKGFSLIYDIVRRFAQPLGIHLDDWKGRIIDIDKGVVRLLPVAERARQLFGAEGAAGLADRIERTPGAVQQLELFPDAPESVVSEPGRRRRFAPAVATAPREATTLDRVHTAMLLQASGRSNALRTLLSAEQQRGPDFLRLSNALSALYPQGSDEKRLLDAMLLAVPR